MLSHTNLSIYYDKIFGMVQHHKYSVDELERMIPFERDLYFDMLINFIKQQEEKQRRK
jgi:hypothetical protein